MRSCACMYVCHHEFENKMFYSILVFAGCKTRQNQCYQSAPILMQTMDGLKRLPSPPRPRRMLMIPDQVPRPVVPTGFGMPRVAVIRPPAPVTWTPGTDVNSFESEMVDRAMRDLPNVLSQVFNIQKGQVDDIKTLKQIVQETKDKIAEVEERREDIKEEISSMTRKIYMTEEDIKENGKTCKLLKSDIENLVTERYEKQRIVDFLEEDVEYELRKLKRHKEKKAKFAEDVAEYETKTSEVQQKMNKINKELIALKEQRSIMEKDKDQTERIVNGIVAKEIKTDIDDLVQKLKDVESKNKAKENQIAKEKTTQRQIDQTMQVLQKKNAAQLTRLRRQVKDVQLKNKQWTNQISNLELKISQLRNDAEAI